MTENRCTSRKISLTEDHTETLICTLPEGHDGQHYDNAFHQQWEAHGQERSTPLAKSRMGR